MAASQNIAALHRAVDCFNARDLDGYMELYDEDVVLHGYPPGVEGKEGARAFYTGFQNALPDAHLEVHQVVADEDTLAARYTVGGTHEDELLGVPATGRRVSVDGQTFLHMADGRIVERWQSMDALGLLTQLGAIPAAS